MQANTRLLGSGERRLLRLGDRLDRVDTLYRWLIMVKIVLTRLVKSCCRAQRTLIFHHRGFLVFLIELM